MRGRQQRAAGRAWEAPAAPAEFNDGAAAQVLLGFFEVTEHGAAVPTTVINPGAKARAERRVWNNGDDSSGGVKLLTLELQAR